MDKQQDITIEREFEAPRELVWKAWTEPAIIKKWWGPKDFTAPEIHVDLRVGGKYIYCMHGPKGSEFDMDLWSSGIYKEIVPMKKLVVTDYFSDEHGNKVDPVAFGMSPDFPKEADVIVTFADVGESTKLTIRYPKPKTEKQFEAMKKSGMNEGWNQSLDKMARLIED